MKALVGWFPHVAVVSVVMTALSACGGSPAAPPPGPCLSTPACGGDIVGTWKVVSACAIRDVGAQESGFRCPDMMATTSGFRVVGTVTYNADLTYSANLTVWSEVVVDLPPSCLIIEGKTLTCGQAQAEVRASLLFSGYRSGSCTGNGSGGCTCTLVKEPLRGTGGGTYSTTPAGVLTELTSGGETSNTDYCVTGSTLTVSPQAGMAGLPDVMGTITLVKQ